MVFPMMESTGLRRAKTAPGADGSIAAFNRGFNRVLDAYERTVRHALKHPGADRGSAIACLFVASLGIYPFVGRAFFPQTDAGQFTIDMKVPTGTRIEVTNDYVARIEGMIRKVVEPNDLKMVLSNIGVVNDISSLYTTNQGQYTATIQVALSDEHRVGSLEYMDRVRRRLSAEFPDVRAFLQSGSLQDAILNSGMPAPIDVQVNTQDLNLHLRHGSGPGGNGSGTCRAWARSIFHRT